jgi:hypothetical protein
MVVIDESWVRRSLEESAIAHGVELARLHLDQVRRRTLDRVGRTREAVSTRLQAQIQHWDHRASQLRERELAGKLPASGMNSANARQRADELKNRLRLRMGELDAEAQLSLTPPVVAAGALVIPAGLLGRPAAAHDDAARQDSAVAAVLAAERSAGRSPGAVGTGHNGYDIESHAADGSLLFITVKWKAPGSDIFVATQTDIAVARNTPAHHVLALVDTETHAGPAVRYLRHAVDDIPDPGFAVAAVRLSWRSCFERALAPS